MKLDYRGIMKRGRIFDNDLVNEIRNSPCIVCGRVPSDPAHLRSRGAGGGDRNEDGSPNLVSLCRLDHGTQHAIGWKSFAEKYNLPIEFSSGYPKLK